MIEHIQTELPFWLAAIGLMLAIFLSFWSYSGKRNKELFSLGLRILLGAIRGIVFLILFILFIGLIWKKKSTINEKPVYLIAVDNSRSIISGEDSLNMINQVNQLVKDVTEVLSDRFDVRKISFGQSVLPGGETQFSDQLTDFGKLFSYLRSSFYTQPVGELLMITDGIPTSGQSLNSAQSKWPFPISIVGIGDTTETIDLRIDDVIVNDLVYLNTKFPIEILLQADNSQQKMASVNLSSGGEPVADTVVLLDDIDGKGRVTILVEATELGNHVYDLSISPLENELNLYNNERSFAIEVVDQKHQVVLIYNSPNPDIRVIEESLTESDKYELTTWQIDQGEPILSDYDVAIVYQLPGKGSIGNALVNKLIQSEINTLYIVGPGTSLVELKSNLNGISFPSDTKLNEDFTGRINEQFNLFKLPENLAGFLSEMPPLRAPLTGIQINTEYSVLLNQKIKGIDIADPLVWFMRSGNSKLGFWWGEGVWRWNLFEYLTFGDHYYTKSLISSIISYLTINEVTDPLKVDVPASVSSFDKLTWKARLYNESFEMINDPDLFIDLTFTDGSKRKLEFRKLDGKYWLELNNLSPGKIIYNCYTQISNIEYRKSGVIQVLETPVENLDIRARFDDLRAIANQKGGEFFTQDQNPELLNYLDNLDSEKSSSYTETRWVNLLNWQYLLFLIVFLASMEWILRRWSGTR